MAAVVAQSPNYVAVDFLASEIEDAGPGGILDQIRDAINRADGGKFHGIVLGFGFRPQELTGLQAKTLPIVVPRPIPFRSSPAPFGRLSLFWKDKMPDWDAALFDTEMECPESSSRVGRKLSCSSVSWIAIGVATIPVASGWRLVAKAEGRVLAAEKLPK